MIVKDLLDLMNKDEEVVLMYSGQTVWDVDNFSRELRSQMAYESVIEKAGYVSYRHPLLTAEVWGIGKDSEGRIVIETNG